MYIYNKDELNNCLIKKRNKMKKFENVYQDAALMRKVLWGRLMKWNKKDLEKRLAECPDLRNVYEQLQSGRL